MPDNNYHGTWYFAERPKTAAGGSLKLDYAEGFRLLIVGDALREVILEIWGIDMGGWQSLPGTIKPALIIGQTEKGYAYLFNCEIDHHNTSYVSVGYALFCKQPREFKVDPIFEQVTLEFSHLDRFMDATGFTPQTPDYDTFFLQLKRLPKHKVDLPDYSLTFTTNIAESLVNGSRHQFLLTETPVVQVNFQSPQPVATVIKVANELRHFFSFATGQAGELKSISSYLAMVSDDGDDPYYRLAGMLYDHFMYMPNAKSRNSELFRYSMISSNFPHFLDMWFTLGEKIRPTIELYLNGAFRPDQDIEDLFMSLAQAIESFHRRICEGTYIAEDEFTIIYQKLIEAIPKETIKPLRQRITNSLQYMNEFSLRKRLKDLIKNYLIDFQTLIDKLIPNIDNFIAIVVDTRNYHTHYTALDNSQVAVGEELINLTGRLRLLLQLSILKALDFTPDMIYSIAETNGQFRRFMKKS